MKTTGIVRRIDELGRIVIPKEIRKTLKFREGEPLEIYAFKDEILLKKYSIISNVLETAESIVSCLTEVTQKLVLITDGDKVIATSGKIKDLKGEKLSKEGYKILQEKKSFAINPQDNIKLIKVTTGDETRFCSQVIIPITTKDGDGIGLIALFDTDKTKIIDSSAISFLKFSSLLLSKECEYDKKS